VISPASGPRPTRRGLLAAATAGAGLLALPADALTQRASAGAPYILKPLPPEWFVDYGTNAEMRWDSVDPPLVTPYNTSGYFFDAVVRHPVTVV
jgi:hypothetical protein